MKTRKRSVGIKLTIFAALFGLAFAVPTRRKLLAADATTGSPQATGTTSPETRALEQQMLELVNEDRADAANFAETHGQAQPLIWDERLAEVARARSEDMIARNYFGHVDPDGFTPDVHLTMAGIRWTAMSENIVIRTTVERGEAAFMDEPRFDPNHRGAILNGQLTHVGIGVIAAPNGELYITQEFARY